MMKGNRLGIFGNKNFLLLWLGQFVSNIGSNMSALAVMWYVLEVTGSSAKAGITLVYTVVPYILLSPIAGSIADRLDRKKIIVITDFANGILVGAISILIYTKNMELWMLYGISAVMSMLSAFFGPAISAAIPSIVKKEDLVKANSLSQTARYTTSILGPALGGVLIVVLGIPGLFLLDSISYIISAISECFINVPKVIRSEKEREKSIREDMKEGFLYTVSNKKLLHIIIVGGVIINFFFAPFDLILAVFSRETLKLGSEAFGTLLAAMSVGGGIMTLIVPIINKKVDSYKLMFIGLTLEGLILVGFSFSSNLYIAIMMLGLMGCSFGIVNVSIGAVIPMIVPNEKMGRVSSIFGLLCQVSVPLGYYLGGLFLENYSGTDITLVSGILVTLAGLSTIGVSRGSNSKKHIGIEAAENIQ